MRRHILLMAILAIFLYGCAGQVLKQCDTYACLEEAALKCEPAKGNYYDLYVEIKPGRNVIASSPQSGQKVKSKTCSVYARNAEGKERTCNMPEIIMQVELQNYNDLFYSPLISEQLCSGDEVRLGSGKNLPTGQPAEPATGEEVPTAPETPPIRCEFVWPQEIIIGGRSYPCPYERGYCYNPGVSNGETKCCNWNQAEGYSNCEELRR